MIRPAKLLAAAALSFAALAAVAIARPASAQDAAASAPAEVMVVLARETEGAIDPSLANVAALRRQPFSAYRSMEVLSRNESTLSAATPLDFALPNGRQLRVELEAALPDGRYRVRVSINRPGQADYLPLLQVVASPGDPFFVAGQTFRGGTLVIGVRIGVRQAASRGR